ncbi:MAG: allophanate hydrolase subunit 1 [Candidatus Nanopelagicales bacterium]
MRFHQYGEHAVLIDTAPGLSHLVAAEARRTFGAGLLDAVPTAACVLLDFARPTSAEQVAAVLPAPDNAAAGPADSAAVTIQADFDGPDLAEVAAAADCSPERVVELLTAVELTVEFCGFAPGFAYLIGLPEVLHLPRRATPRTRVPAGSVALAAGYAAVYPADSPGGWHLVGRTRTALFRPDRDPPALLQPGMRVRFDQT